MNNKIKKLEEITKKHSYNLCDEYLDFIYSDSKENLSQDDSKLLLLKNLIIKDLSAWYSTYLHKKTTVEEIAPEMTKQIMSKHIEEHSLRKSLDFREFGASEKRQFDTFISDMYNFLIEVEKEIGLDPIIREEVKNTFSELSIDFHINESATTQFSSFLKTVKVLPNLGFDLFEEVLSNKGVVAYFIENSEVIDSYQKQQYYTKDSNPTYNFILDVKNKIVSDNNYNPENLSEKDKGTLLNMTMNSSFFEKQFLVFDKVLEIIDMYNITISNKQIQDFEAMVFQFEDLLKKSPSETFKLPFSRNDVEAFAHAHNSLVAIRKNNKKIIFTENTQDFKI